MPTKIVTTLTEHTSRFRASTDALGEIRKFVSGQARQYGFGEEDIDDIRLAVDEACTNIIKHAYEWRDDKYIYIRIAMHNNEMLVSIYDNGKSFDAGRYSVPALQDQLDQKKRGGYGIYLIRKLMDKVEYRKQRSRNEIRMTKKR